MLKSTREQQVEKMLQGGLSNLFKSQTEFSFDQFAISTVNKGIDKI